MITHTFKSAYSISTNFLFYILKCLPINKLSMGERNGKLASALLCPHPETTLCRRCCGSCLFQPLVLLRAANVTARGWQSGCCRGEHAQGCWPHWSLLPSNQPSREIACYLRSIFHALLNCFVLTRCQKWIVTFTQPELGWGS